MLSEIMFLTTKPPLLLRFLKILLIILSNDVQLNPGPSAVSRSFNLANTSLVISVSVPIPVYDVQVTMAVSQVNQTTGTLTGFSSLGTLDLNFQSGTGTTYNNSFHLGPASSNFTVTLQAAGGTFNGFISVSTIPNFSVISNVKVVNSSTEPIPSLPQFPNPVSTAITHPAVLPVQIENIDPVEVSLVIGDTVPVSILNPSILPVQIENSDPIHVTIPVENPIPITGSVSINNPIPSVASTLLSAFKK